ncbi:transmembrane protein, putative (macronuclear) [Tetrahymena thermophila SB210]|uniref:Transmembrane protein, putative n=1 Tax=Tetrahymena thermophila (strain SB210) TaxID=312017 RepID=W7X9Y1_TETTS|nr:transmembrane protein, putative [Tetrahymena thermophila SB210]EWS73203.1 transmembrane protein, putative [Tetrahymena thermophila SB210]|eukprot:XP_012654279.1 transmembrane protein, putative [Tetrahymena thermophila SB210]
MQIGRQFLIIINLESMGKIKYILLINFLSSDLHLIILNIIQYAWPRMYYVVTKLNEKIQERGGENRQLYRVQSQLFKRIICQLMMLR